MNYLLIICCISLLYSCSASKKLAKKTAAFVLEDSALLHTNVGISIYNPATNTYLLNHNANKYFVPASNTKILTCYAAMKYLGDSLVGIQYDDSGDTLKISGTGDPTFLLDEFKQQPVSNFLQKTTKPILLTTKNWQEENWGSGWNWTDFGEDYCQERSPLPMYYNSVVIKPDATKPLGLTVEPPAFLDYFTSEEPITKKDSVYITKQLFTNKFIVLNSNRKFTGLDVPFSTNNEVLTRLFKSTFNKSLTIFPNYHSAILSSRIHSQPTDAVLKPMMHRSDNFFAEQLLLMVSNAKLGYMNDAAIIDDIKKNDFLGIPQMPRWVDGSGLSRYNMFTPQSIIFVLNKMRQEFGMERIKKIFATGGEGTLSSYYKNLAGAIFAKTGTLSSHAALSGFLYTKKGTLLIFSTLTSGYQGSATPVRKAVEKLLLYVQMHN